MHKIFFIITVWAISFNAQAQKFHDISIKKEPILSLANNSDVFLIKLKASTLEPADEEIILECWTEEIFNKPKVLDGNTYNKVLTKYKINKREEEYVIIQSIAYNSEGNVIYNYNFNEFDYKGAIPDSFGAKLIEEVSLIYEMEMFVKIKGKQEEDEKKD